MNGRMTPADAETETRLRQLVESLDGIVWEADAETFRFLDVTGRAEAILGYPAEQWLVEPDFWQKHLHPDDAEWVVDCCATASRRRESHRMTYRMIAADGRTVWLRDHVTVSVGGGGAILHGLMVDVTEERLRADRLAETRQRHDLAVQASPDGLHGLDADGRITFENPAALRVLGYDEGETIGRSWHALVHHQRADGGPDPLQECPVHLTLRDGQSREVEGQVFFRKDGSPFPVEYTVGAIVDPVSGQPTGAVVSFRDVTPKRRQTDLQALETAILGMISADAPLADSLERIVTTVDRILPDARSSIHLVVDGRLRHGAAPGLPPVYREATEGIAIGEAVGSCGTAAWRRQPVIVDDVLADPLWAAYHSLATASGFRACWSTPVLAGDGEALATYALHYATPRVPTADDLALIDRVCHFIRTAIESTRRSEQLKASEAHYRSVYDLVPVAIWEEDWSAVTAWLRGLRAEGVTDLGAHFEADPGCLDHAVGLVRVLDVNRAAVQMFRAVGKDDLIARALDVFVAGDPGSIFAYALEALWAGRREFEGENTLRRLDGETVHVLVRIALPALDDPDGRVVLSEMDVTETRIANERLQLVTQATTDVIWDFDVVHDRLEASDGLKTTFGLDPAEMVDGLERWTARIHPDDLPGVMRHFDHVLASDQADWLQEYRFRRADGTYATVRDQGSVMRDVQGKAVRIVGSLVDVSTQREFERQLVQAQKLDSVGKLTGGIAHDFNNLLTVVLGNLDLLQAHLAAGTPAARLADTALLAAGRAAELTARLLAFARRQPLNPRVVDVAALVHDMRDLVQSSVGERIAVELSAPADGWSALVDPSQLENAILNLCINARDAMPNGGRLALDVARARTDDRDTDADGALTPGDYVVLTVTDSGCGMDAATRARAFDPFFTTKEVGKGTGLGLSMVHGFVEQSKGHVKLESEPGQGTAVRIYLPLARAAVETPTSNSASVEVAVEPILLVEDEPLVREHIAAQLGSLGHPVTAVATAAEALHELQGGGAFGLLYTDIGLPGGMNGADLAVAARALRPTLRVLFMSGDPAPALAAGHRLVAGENFLQKPFRPSDLTAAIDRVLAHPGASA